MLPRSEIDYQVALGTGHDADELELDPADGVQPSLASESNQFQDRSPEVPPVGTGIECRTRGNAVTTQ